VKISSDHNQYEGTFGGRLVRDRLWFFTAGRYKNRCHGADGLHEHSYATDSDDKRYEAKLTAQLTPHHAVVGAYTNSHQTTDNSVSNCVMDSAAHAVRSSALLLSLNYNGILTQNPLLEGRYSKMQDQHERRRARSSRERCSTSSGNRMWSLTFCGHVPAKQRNNKEYLVKACTSQHEATAITRWSAATTISSCATRTTSSPAATSASTESFCATRWRHRGRGSSISSSQLLD
jgi:hypothetical protein